MASILRCAALFALILPPAVQSSAQSPPSAPAAAAAADPELDLAAEQIDRALFLRCLCAENTLRFGPDGKPLGVTKATDWTLAGIAVQKVRRESPTSIELDGLRVAIRYAPDRREFDRHPLKDEAIHLHLATSGSPETFARTLHTVSAQGIERSFIDTLPPFWQHFFSPQLPWPPDQQVTPPVIDLASPTAPQTGTAPVLAHRDTPGYTSAATTDRVQGAVTLRLVVDATGTPRQVSITQPLGYGLDARAAESASKLRFTPGTQDGKPAAFALQFREDFVIAPGPR